MFYHYDYDYDYDNMAMKRYTPPAFWSAIAIEMSIPKLIAFDCSLFNHFRLEMGTVS